MEHQDEWGKSLCNVHSSGSLFEIRLLGQQPRTCSGLFDDPRAAAAQVVAAMERWGEASFYYTLTPIDPNSEYARTARRNVIVPNPRATAKDADILHRVLYLIEIDPVRKSNNCSTAYERSLARGVTKQVRSHLRSQSWPTPTLVSSGNGYHLLYRQQRPTLVATT